ncbi:hypothetical protein K466DRAFT_65045 [Polyporus arcularius HHB13444]|uniref:Uncharacterized protein n=1 Tax=Polyporus arcularius HHB13444 TaxID=1314778 RepID=A0A5C3PHS6_9APHY|nr:hypothetical protein K466DRAFT_65045 [Polyporus arcularius HHB13444]
MHGDRWDPGILQPADGREVAIGYRMRINRERRKRRKRREEDGRDGIGRSLSVSCMAETACGRRSLQLVQAGLESTPGPGWDSRLDSKTCMPFAVCCLPLPHAHRQTLDSGPGSAPGPNAGRRTQSGTCCESRGYVDRGPPRIGKASLSD